MSHACGALLASLVIDFEISSYEFSSHPRVNPPLLSQPCALRFKFLLEINTSTVFVNGILKQAMYSKSTIDVRAFQRGVTANLTRSVWQFMLSGKKKKRVSWYKMTRVWKTVASVSMWPPFRIKNDEQLNTKRASGASTRGASHRVAAPSFSF